MLLAWWIIVHLPEYAKGEAEWLRGIGFFLAGVGIAPLGLWLANLRTGLLREQTEIENLRTGLLRERTEIESKRRITDAFTKAVDLLGNDKVAVRQGGIYALGRLALEDSDERPKILAILAAYVREVGSRNLSEIPGGLTSAEDNASETKPSSTKPSSKKSIHIDLEAAIAVIRDLTADDDGRRYHREKSETISQLEPRKSKRGLDLSNTALIDADISHAVLLRANLSDSQFRGCVFVGVHLDGANMVDSRFIDVDFRKATFDSADMRGAVFAEDTNMKDATFASANVRSADLSGTKNLIADQIDDAEGDAKTKLPQGISRPAKWRNQGRS